jgi:hypothetical protein
VLQGHILESGDLILFLPGKSAVSQVDCDASIAEWALMILEAGRRSPMSKNTPVDLDLESKISM